MIIFWVVVVIMVAGVLLLLAVPLLGLGKRPLSATRAEANLSVYRDQLRELDAELAATTLDQAQYRTARGDLESRVLEDAGSTVSVAASAAGKRLPKTAIAALAVSVPVVAVALYLVLGTPAGLEPQTQTQEVGAEHSITPQQIEDMVGQLKQKLESQPDDAEGWIMLARSYIKLAAMTISVGAADAHVIALRHYDEARAAYARAAKLLPDNANVLADYAEVLAHITGTLLGEPEKIIRQALQADPNHIKALWLAGSAVFERKDYRAATEPWQKILKLVPADSQVASMVTASISEARDLGGLSPPASPLISQPINLAQNNMPQARPGAAGETVSGTVSGTVSLDPAFKARVAATDAVFVFARSTDRPTGPPLAALRKTVKDLPLTFTLDDSMAMMPNLNLSSATSIVVGVRISKAGNVTPSPGDIQGFSQPVKVGAKGISITIDTEVK